MSTFRRYIKGDSLPNIVDVNLHDIHPKVRDYHIVLAFATDYDDQGNHRNGVFTFNGDLHRIIEALTRFKEENQKVNIKLFISIGNRDSRFPFQAYGAWVYWATDSLKRIFRNLGDLEGIQIGIDVFYEDFITQADDFATCVRELITNLKNDQIITLASITLSAATYNEYNALFQSYGDSINWVVYQFYNDTIANPGQFNERYQSLTNVNSQPLVIPRVKFLAGYSTKKDDWKKINPIVFFKSIISLLQSPEAPAGASIWDVDGLDSNGWAILPIRAVLAP